MAYLNIRACERGKDFGKGAKARKLRRGAHEFKPTSEYLSVARPVTPQFAQIPLITADDRE
jgi:hypothetical protein